MTVPYTFADAVGAIPLSELDANFAAIPNYANTAGTVVTPTQTAITSVGTLTNLSVAGNVLTGSRISATGNITGNYIIGNGSQLTGLAATYGNANVAAYLPTYTGNIGGGNIGISGAINAVGEITSFANLVTTGGVQATGNITGSNLGLTGNVSAAGNITAANFLGNVAATTVSASGNITTAGYFVGIFAGSISGNVTAPGTNTQVVYNNSGNLAGSTGFTFNSAANALVVTGNVTGGNILTSGLVSATSTITSAANITGANILTGGTVSAVGNVRGANFNTTGLITATGNIAGNYFIGNGSQLTGIATGTPTAIVNGTSNVNVVSSGGNITTSVGGTANVIVVATTGQYVTGIISATGNVIANNFVGGGAGAPAVSSSTTLDLSSPITVQVLGGGTFRLPSLTTADIGNLTPANGDIIYNSSLNKFQGFENGAWGNLI
jgi:hypothetical protein